MKKWLIVLFVLLMLPGVFALSVTLDSPSDSSTSSSSTVTFECSVSDDVAISSVKLYTNISGSWAQTGSTISGNVTSGSFQVTSIADGTYEWNCLATNINSTTSFASSNYTVIVSTGGFSGTIADQTWNEDTIKSNAFDLDDYFTGASTYNYSGNSNINVSIDGSNQVTFVPNANWSGSEVVIFGADTGDNSNSVNLTVTNINDAPYTVGNIGNKTLDENENYSLDMTDYFAEFDTSDSLNYSIDADYFTLVEDGDDVTIVPDEDWSGSEEVSITASDGSLDVEGNGFTITVDEDTSTTETEARDPTIDSYTPSKNVVIAVNESQEFVVEYSDDGSVSLKWTVDGVDQGVSSSKFTFTGTENGVFIITVTVDDGSESVSQSWTVTVGTGVKAGATPIDVGSILSEQTSSSVCGNGVLEGDETCSSCALDVTCPDGYVCGNGVCELKANVGRAVLIFFIIIFVILIGGFGVYYITTLKKAEVKTEEDTFRFKSGGLQKKPPSDYTDFYKK
jgi:hypothetical protein